MEDDKENIDKTEDERHVNPELKSDAFGSDEQRDICTKVKLCLENDLHDMDEWITNRELDLKMYQGAKPSVIENLDKEDWQSDRNLGMCAATCDAHQATLLATCYNEERIHFKPTKTDSADRSDNLEKFTKWALGPQEADVYSEVDDYIHNRITQGVSYFKIGWKVWYKWLDRRVPKYDTKANPPRFIKYEIETEHKRFERGYIENIDDVSDLIYPTEGSTLQSKDHLIHRIHTTVDTIIKRGESGEYLNVDEEYKKKLKKYVFDNRLNVLKKEKLEEMGLKTADDVTDDMLRHFEIDIYEWYGEHDKKGGNEEEYRLIVDVTNMTFLAGKPLRKINRKAKRPFVGSGLIRRPGLVQGTSIPSLIADPVNAFNNTYNQKSDFQYVENCPYFFYDPQDPLIKSTYALRPGRGYPVENPNNVSFPKNTRSMGWAEYDFELLFQIIERLTGAASYFMSNRQGISGTATRDAIINEKSETRFGLMVKRLIKDISEAITMFVNQYQDWAPPDLGERVLGDDGKQLFPNMSLETLMGDYDAYVSPDIISGSKTLEREISGWALDRLSQTIWFDPMMNPRGNWELVSQAGKKMGMDNIDNLMPPKPQAEWAQSEVVSKKFNEIKQGILPEIDASDDIMTLYMGFNDLKITKYDDLDKEYKPNFDVYLFNLGVAMMQEQKRMMQEKAVNALAMNEISKIESTREDTTNPMPVGPGAKVDQTVGEPVGETG